MNPTERTLRALRAQGYTAQVVEKWNPHARVRHDLFGCIDIVAIHDNHVGVLGVQACADSSISLRRAKAENEPRIAQWIRTGNRFQVWGWAKKGPRGCRKLWTARVVGL